MGIVVAILSAQQWDPATIKSESCDLAHFVRLSLSLVMGGGALMSLISFIGCYGANNDNKCIIGMVSAEYYF